MSGFLTTELLPGIGFALFGVAFWAAGFVVAYYLYKRWRGDGPRDGD
jgi:hypothetical protein